MNKPLKKKASKIGGIPATYLVIPMGVVLATLLVLIVLAFYKVNLANSNLTDMMQSKSLYQQEATRLQASSSVLSETAGSFVLLPLNEDGSINVGPLLTYVEELGSDRLGPQVAARFRDYQVSPEVQGYIDEAADYTEKMREVQIHAISLIQTVYPLPPVPELAGLPLNSLTQEELAMSDQERLAYARRLVLARDYSQLRFFVAQDINGCHQVLQAEFSQSAAEYQQYISTLRTLLWVVIFAIIVVLATSFFLFYHWLIVPLWRYADLISQEQKLTRAGGIRELRVVTGAYNDLLRRRNRLEAILRSAAETDTLTGLPNRYSLERFVLENGEDGGPLAVLLFDVNYLKQVNDNQGHLAGDNLLRTAGACIRECFDQGELGCCYRIGGDEFAAVLLGCSEGDVQARLNRFALALEREGISVSAGYGYTDHTDEDSFRKLMDVADKRMYAQKKRIHQRSALA